MIKIIVTKNKGNDKKDKAIFERVIKIAESIFGTNGGEVLMFRKKHYCKTPDIQIIVEEEKDIIPEMEIKVREKFNYSDLGMNGDVSILRIFADAADLHENF